MNLENSSDDILPSFLKKYKSKIWIKLSKKILKPIKNRLKNLHKLP